VAPVQYWQTQRLLLAKQLLTDTAIPISDVAKASGFSNAKEVHSLLAERYRLAPGDLRKKQPKGVPKRLSEFWFRLSYRPPLDWEYLLDFLAKRAVPDVEAVEEATYSRTVQIEQGHEIYLGVVEIRNDAAKHSLFVRLSDTLLPVSTLILERTKWLFDVRADPAAIRRTLGPLCTNRPGLRVPGSFDCFEMAVRAVIGQQISVGGGRTLIGRLAVRFGTPIATPCPLLIRLFPTAQRIARASTAQIRQIGITEERARTIRDLSRAVAKGGLLLEPGLNPNHVTERLRKIRGIGEWTAQYIAMRALFLA
jgi:AraC family transcriptional regulator of adaptative response / DNA-3-methyladenine glycosylase II